MRDVEPAHLLHVLAPLINAQGRTALDTLGHIARCAEAARRVVAGILNPAPQTR